MEIIFESTGNIEAFEEIEADQVPELPVQLPEEQLIIEEPEVEQLIIEEPEEEKTDIEEKEDSEEEKEIIREVQVVRVVSDNIVETEQIVSVNNIMNTPLNEYTIEQSLLLYIFLALFVSGFVIVVRGSILKWS